MWVEELGAEELEERPKLCVLKELVSGGFGARSVGVRREKMRRILTKVGGVQQSCRWKWGDGCEALSDEM